MGNESRTNNPVELSSLAARIDEAIGGPVDAIESPAATVLNRSGAWEYHFESDERWGFVAAGPDESVETPYPGWGMITIKPNHCAVFYKGDLAGIVSPCGGRIGGYAVAARDEQVGELEDAMVDAFRAEYDMLTSTNERAEHGQSGMAR